ncbi:MAG: formate dehydrogenase accessory sulfurtransferase FdhD [Deltaproteobacteria bacterium]|nr:formate dehydrogenase accessory sulfurtransferase FdhD [Deltaproteobacteria bacterium]
MRKQSGCRRKGVDILQKEETTKADEAIDEGRDLEKVSSVWASVYDRTGERERRTQWVIKEQPVSLVLNGRELVTLLCAGHHLEELAAGFLHGEGFLQRPSDLTRLEVDPVAGKVEVEISSDASLAHQLWMKRTITSGCGKGSLFYYALDALLSKPVESALQITPEQIQGRVDDMNRLSETYRRTHGVHNIALATPRETILFRDDIGRHNATDMIVGHCFLNSVTLNDKLLITTGRLTSEILIKAGKVGIPVLVSRNTATTLAIQLALSLNITLIGYARAGRFTVYSGEKRIHDHLPG